MKEKLAEPQRPMENIKNTTSIAAKVFPQEKKNLNKSGGGLGGGEKKEREKERQKKNVIK